MSVSPVVWEWYSQSYHIIFDWSLSLNVLLLLRNDCGLPSVSTHSNTSRLPIDLVLVLFQLGCFLEFCNQPFHSNSWHLTSRLLSFTCTSSESVITSVVILPFRNHEVGHARKPRMDDWVVFRGYTRIELLLLLFFYCCVPTEHASFPVHATNRTAQHRCRSRSLPCRFLWLACWTMVLLDKSRYKLFTRRNIQCLIRYLTWHQHGLSHFCSHDLSFSSCLNSFLQLHLASLTKFESFFFLFWCLHTKYKVLGPQGCLFS